MNYTRPDDKNYEDKPEDWLFSALAFSAALGFVVPEGQGIIVDVKGDMIGIRPSAKRIIVYNNGQMMEILNASERTDLKEGSWVRVISKNNIIN